MICLVLGLFELLYLVNILIVNLWVSIWDFVRLIVVGGVCLCNCFLWFDS